METQKTKFEIYTDFKKLNPLETSPCTRCGGTGSYSWCSAHGSRCFKCNGNKQVLTKKGRVAKAYISHLRTTLKPASELKIGDFVHADDFFTGKFGFFAIVKISEPFTSKFTLNGVEKVNTNLSYEVQGMRASFTVGIESQMKVWTGVDNLESWKEGIEFQATLSKAGKATKATSAKGREFLASLEASKTTA